MTIESFVGVILGVTTILGGSSDPAEIAKSNQSVTRTAKSERVTSVLSPGVNRRSVTSQPSKLADALAGPWVGVDNEEDVILFEPQRVGTREAGTIMFSTAQYADDHVVLSAGEHPLRLDIELRGDRLKISMLNSFGRKQQTVYRKVAETPSRLKVRPVYVAKQLPLPESYVATLQKELKWRRKRDKEVRERGRWDDKTMWETVDLQIANAARVRMLLEQIGWIDVKRFGLETSMGVFYLVQHSSDLELMLAVLPHLKRDVDQGLLKPARVYALLYDRVQVFQALPQRYGTQVGFDADGNPVIDDLEDASRVELFRAELNMEPLEKYLQRFRSR